MGTIQLLFVFLAFILFGYFVLISFQRDEQMLREEAKKEMFDDMLTIGNLANTKAYLQAEESGNPLTYAGFISPGYLLNRPYSEVDYMIISDTLIRFTGFTIYEPEVVYERYCTPSNSMGL